MSEESDPGEYDGDESASTSTQTVITSASSDGVERERRRNWCEVFRKKDGKQGPKRKFVRCKLCISYPSIVSMHCYRQRIPAIATIDGTKYREEVIEEHEKHDCHDAALKAKCRCDLWSSEPISVPLLAGLRRMEADLFLKVSAYVLDVYNDAQRGTLSAWSWPSRVLTRLKADGVKIDSFSPFVPSPNQIQYLNPVQHREFLNCIAVVGQKQVKKEISEALAVSLRVDGSVDRQQIDSKHVCAQIVTTEGDLVSRFLGFSEPVERGVTGYVQCVQQATKAVQPWNGLMKVTSSIVTDGESLNSGERNGLWKKLEEEKSFHDSSHGPLIKIWCAAHRSNLAYRDVSKSVSEVRLVTSDVVSVGSYFHVSGVQTHELKEAATSSGLSEPLHWPDFKEMRFAEFSHQLFAVFLRNYRSCICYWEKGHDVESAGFLRKWKNKDRLLTICVLADVTYLLKGLQKSLQKDTCVLSDLPNLKTRIISQLEELQNEPLTGGWEELFLSKLDGQNVFFGIELQESVRRTNSHNLYVPDCRAFAAVRVEIISSLRNFLEDRLIMDDGIAEAVETLKPEKFANLSKDKIKAVQQVLLPDFELREVSHSLRTVSDVVQGYTEGITQFQLLNRLILQKDPDYEPTIVALARVIAAKPHSMDVERIVSSYNLIKSTDRSSLSGDALQDYLIVRHNMTSIAKFDVRPAVEEWISRRERRPRQDRDIQKYMQQEYVTSFFGTHTKQVNPTQPFVRF